MKLGFIMDPIDKIKVHKDTSYFLMKNAYERGHDIYYIDQEDIYYLNGKVQSSAIKLEFSNDLRSPFSSRKECQLNLDELDVVLVRKDPPFDRRYFYTTLLLDFLDKRVLIINSPQALRNWNEKLSSLFYSSFSPPTLISNKVNQIESFLSQHKKIILKPIDGHGGRGLHIVKIGGDINRNKIQEATKNQSHKVICQKFVEEAAEGDKRIIIVNGKPVGAILRKNTNGELHNLDQGGQAFSSPLTERDLKICAALEIRLVKEGLFFVGIDLLGPYLTEINVTSPTGLQEMSRFENKNLGLFVIEKIEELKFLREC